MEREMNPDYAAEEFYQYLIPPEAFEGPEEPDEKDDPRVVLCRKRGSHGQDKSEGAAADGHNLFRDEICLVAPAAKAAG